MSSFNDALGFLSLMPKIPRLVLLLLLNWLNFGFIIFIQGTFSNFSSLREEGCSELSLMQELFLFFLLLSEFPLMLERIFSDPLTCHDHTSSLRNSSEIFSSSCDLCKASIFNYIY
ncbi:unnamed protein product [Moneuplotes crassus]|uniref:Uncharacterized protein n=1 Tax=Euplotes crassus TaxID=5936 RepID=A0AAD1XJT1_EUPCR|nr:unnamed protein product [Moneuplotes crassus]